MPGRISVTAGRLALGRGVRVAARWLRRRSDTLDRLARTAPRELADEHRRVAHAYRMASRALLEEAYRRRLLPERRAMPRSLAAPCGPFQRLRRQGFIDARLFGAGS